MNPWEIDTPPELDPLGNEAKSGSHYLPATQHDLRETQRVIVSGDVRWYLGGVVTAIAIAFAVFFKMDARAQEKVDAGVAPITDRLDKDEKRIEKVETVVQQLALDGVRQTVMQEMIVRQMGMIPPPPAPKLDGGT